MSSIEVASEPQQGTIISLTPGGGGTVFANSDLAIGGTVFLKSPDGYYYSLEVRNNGQLYFNGTRIS